MTDQAETSEPEPETEAPEVALVGAATGSVVWMAAVMTTFEPPRAGAFSERDDAEQWIDEQIGEEEGEAQLTVFIVDHPEWTQREVANALGVPMDGEPPYEPRPQVDGSVTKGQFADDFAQMTDEQKLNLAWQMRKNYQGLLAEVDDVRGVLEVAGFGPDDLAAQLGVEGEDAEVLRDLFWEH